MSGYGRNSRVRAARRRPYVRVVGTRHADPGIRAARLAVAGREGAGHRRGARDVRHPVLPAAERADRPPGGARLRPGARQAAAGAASPPPAHALAAPEGHEGGSRQRRTVRMTRRAASPGGRAGLDALLADPRRALIGTDFDGTLSPIVPDPQDARAHPEAVPVLTALAKAVGTLAVITGRPAAEAVALGGVDAVPGLVVLGHYAGEPWQDGELPAPPPSPAIQAARAALPGVLAAAAAPAGTRVEDKEY